ncbi:MAG: superoxide dismutase [Candidatus Babeliaceae bacterium]|nr:superoxide dismutase [Candidatus Babeliaceae bacterium]
MVFQPLPYAFDALEPQMDARTVEIHYTKHHRGYFDKLEASLKGYPEYWKRPLIDLLTNLNDIPETVRMSVRNNGGGLWVHDFFWRSMAPGGLSLNKRNAFAAALVRDFGSIEKFEKDFKAAAASFFGSGWTWLVRDTAGKLWILSTPGHDLPTAAKYVPLLVVDVWEHAYYLKYQNRRAEFLDNWWQLIDWQKVEKRFLAESWRED